MLRYLWQALGLDLGISTWSFAECCHWKHQLSVCNCRSGVPQGSVLDPILFILFKNDTDAVCQSSTKLKLFADDLKLYSVVSVKNPSSSSVSLQQSLDNIFVWANEWQFSINVSKTNILTLSNKLCSSFSWSYSINHINLPNSDILSYLGIMVDSCLSFTEHINHIVSESLQRCGVLFWGFVSRDLTLMKKAFVIRPIFEFDSCTWNPSQKQLVDLIEAVQRRFIKRIPCLSSLSYTRSV